ncbi:MAG: hypothetical protein HYY17_16290 [Planctomycetes bacterium]|nr:hypothetical protein [Planctomycetota bacterium]
MRIAISAAVLLLAAGTAQAQAKKGNEPWGPAGIEWQGDWDEAVKEATARNVPIMFAVHQDG